MFTCSGVPVDRKSSHIKVLTSAKLATTLEDKRKAGCSMTVSKSVLILSVHFEIAVVIMHALLALLSFQIHVRDVSNNIARGCLQHYDLDLGIAFVKVVEFLDVSVVHLRHGMEFLPHGNLVAIQLIDSGALTPLVLSKDSSASEDGKELCKSLKVSSWFVSCFSTWWF